MKKLFFIQLVLGLFQVDQAIKQEIEYHPGLQQGKEYCCGRMCIKKFHNDGLAGGRCSGHIRAITRFSALMTLGTVIAFLRLLWTEGRRLGKLGYSFLLGGALSNLYDRFRRGYVVDYVRFQIPFKKLSRLVFNLADFCIFIGTIFILLSRIMGSEKDE